MPGWEYLPWLATVSGTMGMWLLLPKTKDGMGSFYTSRTYPKTAAHRQHALIRVNRGMSIGGTMTACALAMFVYHLPCSGPWFVEVAFLPLVGTLLTGSVGAVVSSQPARGVVWASLAFAGSVGLCLLLGAWLPALALVAVHAGLILPGLLGVSRAMPNRAEAPCNRQTSEPALAAAVGMIVLGVLSVTFARALALGGACSTGEAFVQHSGFLLGGRVAYVGVAVFAVGLIGLLSRRNLILVFLSSAMMLLGGALNLVAWSHGHQDVPGQPWAVLAVGAIVPHAACVLKLLGDLFRNQGNLETAVWQEVSSYGPSDPGRVAEK